MQFIDSPLSQRLFFSCGSYGGTLLYISYCLGFQDLRWSLSNKNGLHTNQTGATLTSSDQLKKKS